MNYTHRLTICASNVELANGIARVLDPDVGGALNFGSTQCGPDAKTPQYTVCDTIISPTLAAQVAAMMANPAVLHGAAQAGYAARYPELTSLTLADCQAFVAGSLIRCEPRTSPPEDLADILAGWSLVLMHPAPFESNQ